MTIPRNILFWTCKGRCVYTIGKTTIARLFQQGKSVYINWDNENHRQMIMEGPAQVAEYIGLPESPVIIFDEIHKFPHWKNFIKGFYDTYAVPATLKIIITGSARLDIYT